MQAPLYQQTYGLLAGHGNPGQFQFQQGFAQPMPAPQQQTAATLAGLQLVSRTGCVHSNASHARQLAHVELCDYLSQPGANKRKQYNCSLVGDQVTQECINDLLAGNDQRAKEKFRRRAQRNTSQKSLRKERKATKSAAQQAQAPAQPPRTEMGPSPPVSLDQVSGLQMTAAPAMPLPLWNDMSNLQMPPAPIFGQSDADLQMAFESAADLPPAQPSPFKVPQDSISTMSIAEQARQTYPMGDGYLLTPPDYPFQ